MIKVQSGLLVPSMSLEKENFIIGAILGDGHIQKAKTLTGRCRMTFGHSAKQEDYVYWKYEKLKEYCQTVGPPKRTIKKAAEGKEYQESRFYTSYLDVFKTFHSKFYVLKEVNGKMVYIKTIPEDLCLYFNNPMALVVWFLDDGTYRTDCESGRIATQSFSYDENTILKGCLDQKFGIKVKIESSTDALGNSLYGLAIPARGGHWKNFVSLIKETIIKEIPTMSYKVMRKTP
uniref:hypothetical protein n=1 Tax=Gormaniella terricola TaxID=2904618 RepID=UPI0021CD130D|nr:hypothetical protein [Gormaniella terricola]UWV18223.1 hypothetical protein [Gormaniella terricola]